MAVIVSDSNNASYDGYLATASGFYRAEAYNLGSSSTTAALALTTARIISPTFANAGNINGIVLAVNTTSIFTDRTLTVRLQEAVTVGSFNTTTERVNITAHGFSNGMEVSFTSTGTLPSGITSSTSVYFIVNKTADDFQISLTAGGSAVLLSGTPTGTATCWVVRTSNAMVYSDIYGTYTTGTTYAKYNYNNGYVPFKLTPYAVDTTAGKWRFHVFQSGGTSGTWNLITSDSVNPFYVAWCDNKVSHTDDDTLIVVDLMQIDKTASIAGILGTGATVDSNACVICRNTDYSESNVALLTWHPTPAASYTFTIKGTVWMGTHSGFRVGTSSVPIPAAQKAVISFAAPINGTTTTSKFSSIIGASSATLVAMRSSVFLYGEVPSVVATTTASDSATGQAHVITSVNTGWVNGDTVVVGKQDIVGQGDTTLYTVNSVSTNDITLTGNLATNVRKSGGTIFRTNGFGVKLQGISNSVYGAFVLYQPSFIKIVGMESVDTRLTITASSYYYCCDDAAYRGQYLITDSTFRMTGTSVIQSMSTLFVPIGGFLIQRVYTFRCNIGGPVTGYANATLKSGYFEIYDCACISNNYSANITATNTAKVKCQRNVFENSLRYGYLMSGISCTFTDNRVWGIPATGSLGYYSIGVGQLVNPVLVSDNSVDKSTTGISFQASTSINCTDVGMLFGQQSANTADIYFVGGAIVDYIFDTPVGNLVIDTTEIEDIIPTSKMRIINYNTSTYDDRVYTSVGNFQRCGTGLADTTVRTAGGYSLRFEVTSATDQLAWTQQFPTGDIQNKTMTVSCWVKINSAAFYAGTYTAPTLSITYDNGLTTQTATATNSTSWQRLAVSFTPTTSFGQIDVAIYGATDATSTDSYFYLDDMDMAFPAGTSLNLGGLDLWVDALPVTPTIATVPSTGSVWDVPTSSLTTSGSVGVFVKKLLSVAKFLELK